MGAFDDLVPSKGGEFDDLVPQKRAADKSLERFIGGSMLPGGQYLPDVVYGGKRALDAAAQLAARVAEKIAPGGMLTKMRQDTEAANAQTQAPQPIAGSSIAQGVIPGAVATLAAPAAMPTVLAAALAGGAGGLMEPVDNPGDNFFTQKAKQAGLGAAMGGGAGGALSVAGKVLAPAIGDAQKLLMREGISMTPGQALGGLADKIESKATSIPILGDFIGSARQRGVEDLNKAVYARALAPFGDEGAQVVAKTKAGNEGIKDVGNFLSQKYEQALNKSNPAPFMQDTQDALAKLQTMVPTSKQADFANTVKQLITDNLTPAGTLTPTVAKQVDSKLGSLARGYNGSQDMDQRLYGQALAQAQSEIKQMFAAANPETAPLIKAADHGWATLTQIENAGAMLGSRGGVIGPAQLRNAVKRSDTSLRDRKFARGDALNQDLADAAISVLPSKAPDSGTAGRVLQAALAGGGSLGGALAAPALALPGLAAIGAAALPYTRSGGKITLAMLAKRPDLLKKMGVSLADLVGPAGALAGSGAIQAAQQ